MGGLVCLAGFILFLGTVCALWPEQIADLGVRLEAFSAFNPKDKLRRGRKLLARHSRLTRWSGRIAGGLLVVLGLVLLMVALQFILADGA